MLGRVLHDQEARPVIGDMIVPAFAGTVADRNAVEQLIAAVECLAQFQQIAFAAQRNAELLAHRAGAAVAADHIGRAHRFGRAVGIARGDGNAVRILRRRNEFAAVADRDAGQRLGHRLQQRLQRVLGNQLIGLERHGAVGAGRDRFARLVHRWISQVHQRRLDHRQHDIDVHRHIGAQPGGPDAAGKTEAAIHFHRAGVAAFHFRQELRRRLAFK